MAKHGKLLPARRRRSSATEGSIFLRSAESLGRVIGTLQRQLDDARQRFADATDDRSDAFDPSADDSPAPGTRTPKKKAKSSVRGNRKKTTTAKRTTKSTGRRAAAKRTRNSR